MRSTLWKLFQRVIALKKKWQVHHNNNDHLGFSIGPLQEFTAKFESHILIVDGMTGWN